MLHRADTFSVCVTPQIKLQTPEHHEDGSSKSDDKELHKASVSSIIGIANAQEWFETESKTT